MPCNLIMDSKASPNLSLLRFSKTRCVKKLCIYFTTKVSLQHECILPNQPGKIEKRSSLLILYVSIYTSNSTPGGMQQCSWGLRACTPRWLLLPPQTQWASQPCCAQSHPGTWGGQRIKGSNVQNCILWSVLRDPAQPTFHDMMPIQELLLCRSFHPDLREKF